MVQLFKMYWSEANDVLLSYGLYVIVVVVLINTNVLLSYALQRPKSYCLVIMCPLMLCCGVV